MSQISKSELFAQLDHQAIELPSWAFGNSGTRFRVFGSAGTPRNPQEKIEDAAQVHKYSGIAPSVALHIPWDKVDDYADLSRFANDHGIKLGTINSNTFQDEDYKLGSVCHPDAAVRAKAVAAIVGCCEIAAATDAQAVKVWLGDGTNYPGQGDLRDLQDSYRVRLDHAKAGAREVFAHTDDSVLGRWARRDAVAGLRRLDVGHLRMIERIHRRFAATRGELLKARAVKREEVARTGRLDFLPETRDIRAGDWNERVTVLTVMQHDDNEIALELRRGAFGWVLRSRLDAQSF